MREARIHTIPHAQEVRHLEKAIVSADSVPHSLIQEYAEHTIESLRRAAQEKETETDRSHRLLFVLMHELDAGKILQDFFSIEPHEKFDLDKQDSDLMGAISQIQKAVADELERRGFDEELKKYFSPEDLYTVTDILHARGSHNRIVTAAAVQNKGSGSVQVYKTSETLFSETDDSSERLKHLAEAVPVLMSSTTHPNVAEIEWFDPKTGRCLVKKYSLTTLSELADELLEEQSTIERVKQSHEMLLLILDAIDGAIHLEKLGLVLEDISPKNIAENNQTQAGMLFDFDGLVKRGVKQKKISHRGYTPPDEMTATSADMVFQFLETIRSMLCNNWGGIKWNKVARDHGVKTVRNGFITEPGIRKQLLKLCDNKKSHKLTLTELKQRLEQIIHLSPEAERVETGVAVFD